MPDDLLLINRQAELPDLLSQAIFYGQPYAALPPLPRGRIDRALTALGVGKPEQQATVRDLEAAADCISLPGGNNRAADRIKRAIGGGDG